MTRLSLTPPSVLQISMSEKRVFKANRFFIFFFTQLSNYKKFRVKMPQFSITSLYDNSKIVQQLFSWFREDTINSKNAVITTSTALAVALLVAIKLWKRRTSKNPLTPFNGIPTPKGCLPIVGMCHNFWKKVLLILISINQQDIHAKIILFNNYQDICLQSGLTGFRNFMSGTKNLVNNIVLGVFSIHIYVSSE